ncbi:hypothetical protein GQ607_002493 [Colletotrichum asianum]|uniref:Uncharacterized protein n=1 Tax=Colletotrichum asianum TaxID=702518 RepID=A0A8H3WLC2_9PEZI|nr:hypothetical protein GQ607_002493 [Colletotrichum asianum]
MTSFIALPCPGLGLPRLLSPPLPCPGFNFHVDTSLTPQQAYLGHTFARLLLACYCLGAPHRPPTPSCSGVVRLVLTMLVPDLCLFASDNKRALGWSERTSKLHAQETEPNWAPHYADRNLISDFLIGASLSTSHNLPADIAVLKYLGLVRIPPTSASLTASSDWPCLSRAWFLPSAGVAIPGLPFIEFPSPLASDKCLQHPDSGHPSHWRTPLSTFLLIFSPPVWGDSTWLHSRGNLKKPYWATRSLAASTYANLCQTVCPRGHPYSV